MTSHYGYRRHPIKGRTLFHSGIDLVKGHKEPIYTFTNGRVIFSGLGKKGTGLGGYGIVVLLKDSNNRAQLYAHLDSTNVKKGQFLARNSLVGYQGATGEVTGSHLHYEIRKIVEAASPYGYREDKETSTIDPVQYLERISNQLIEKGASGEAVKFIQQTLITIGFTLPEYGVDGVYGEETEDAVKKFQKSEGIKIDGILGPNTSHLLENEQQSVSTYPGLIKEGSKGRIVKIIQRKLNVKSDGIFGVKTKEAVKHFQSANHLSVDGIVGKNTWGKLF